MSTNAAGLSLHWSTGPRSEPSTAAPIAPAAVRLISLATDAAEPAPGTGCCAAFGRASPSIKKYPAGCAALPTAPVYYRTLAASGKMIAMAIEPWIRLRR